MEHIRNFAERPLYDRFHDVFVERVYSLRVGDPLYDSTDQCVLVSEKHFENVLNCVAPAREEDGNCIHGQIHLPWRALPKLFDDVLRGPGFVYTTEAS